MPQTLLPHSDYTASTSQSPKVSNRDRDRIAVLPHSVALAAVSVTKNLQRISTTTLTHFVQVFELIAACNPQLFLSVCCSRGLNPVRSGRVTIFCCAATPRSRGSIPQRSCVRTIVSVCVCLSRCAVQVGPIVPP